MRLLAPRVAAEGARICHAEVALEVPARLAGDPVRIRQVLTNLAGNAVKFTERGRASLWSAHAPRRRRGPARPSRLAVRDTGIGIPREHQASVFESYTQLEGQAHDPAQLHGGTGLGLAICRRLVDLMGGRIGLESELARPGKHVLGRAPPGSGGPALEVFRN